MLFHVTWEFIDTSEDGIRRSLEVVSKWQPPAGRVAAVPKRCDHGGMPPSVRIVDDHPNFRVTARALIEAEGFEIVGEAEGLAGAIEAARRLGPEVVLLDVQLPDIDGFEVADEVGSNGGPPAVVLTSSRDACEFGAVVERSGAYGFIREAELPGAALVR